MRSASVELSMFLSYVPFHILKVKFHITVFGYRGTVFLASFRKDHHAYIAVACDNGSHSSLDTHDIYDRP